MTELIMRYRGSLLGLACGDAVGTAVEFCARGTFPEVTDMVGGGPFNLQAGQWTDDTSMALCLADSLLSKKDFDAKDQMARYVNWWHWGYLSSTGTCFDIGMTVQRALRHYQNTGEAYAGSIEPSAAGNGSLMRLAPVVLFYYPNQEAILEFSAASSRTTHGAPEAVEACQLFGLLLAQALSGASKMQVLEAGAAHQFSEAKVQAIAQGHYFNKRRDEIRGSGYAIDALEAALWCFKHSDDFQTAVLLATNLGDDADTTAAIVGQLAGAFYGEVGIPSAWLARLHMAQEIGDYAQQLLHA